MNQNKWERFYTPQELSEEIIRLIPKKESFSTIADICAGSGNLLKAAQKRWCDAKLLAIDLDRDVILKLKKDFNNATRKCIDATDIQGLKKKLSGIDGFSEGCDLVVANPPFGFLTQKRPILNKDDFNPMIAALYQEAEKLGRMEATMLVSNISIMKSGGIFASIIPENFFSSIKWRDFRNIFLKYLFKGSYIGTPQEYFSKSNVRTRIFVGKLCLNHKNKIIAPRVMPNIDNKFDIIRGIFVPKLSKGLRNKQDTVPVFHSDTLKYLRSEKENIEERRIFETDTEFKQSALLNKNDVVLIRVGRNCGTAGVIKKRFIGWHATECIYIIRSNNEYNPNEVASELNKGLPRRRKGLTAQYITKGDILSILKNF